MLGVRRAGVRQALHALETPVAIMTFDNFTCRTQPQGPDDFLAYCRSLRYGDYEHGALYYGLEPRARESIRAAHVLFLDQTLDIWVLPGRSRGGDDLRDAHRSNAMTEGRTIRFVSVSQQIARCSLPRKGLGHLAGKPDLRGIAGDFEVNNPSAIEAEHNQGIKQLERRGGDDKHVNGRKVGQVVAQKAPPGRGGDPGPPRHPSSNRGLADLDAELDEFPGDP